MTLSEFIYAAYWVGIISSYSNRIFRNGNKGKDTFYTSGSLSLSSNDSQHLRPLLINKIRSFVLGFAVSGQSYLEKASARGPPRTAP